MTKQITKAPKYEHEVHISSDGKCNTKQQQKKNISLNKNQITLTFKFDS